MLDVYYFAAARAAAGADFESVERVGTLGQLCHRLAELHPEESTPNGALPLVSVLERSSFLCDGQGVGDLDTASHHELDGVQRVDVLPPFAGG